MLSCRALSRAGRTCCRVVRGPMAAVLASPLPLPAGSVPLSPCTLGGPISPQLQVRRQGLEHRGKTQITRPGHQPRPGADLGSVAPCAFPASREGRAMAQPYRDPGGDNFPFLKNFTGIAGAKGQWLRFQRDAGAGAGWAGEQVERSILAAPHARHPVGPQAGTHPAGGAAAPCPGHPLPGDTLLCTSRSDPQTQTLPTPGQGPV